MTRYIGQDAYQEIVDHLTPNCERIIRDYRKIIRCISPILLSCKRQAELTRLIDSGCPALWLGTTLIDNGSGFPREFIRRLRRTFRRVVWHPTNIGMGPAINQELYNQRSEFVIFIEDDLVMEQGYQGLGWVQDCLAIFRENPHVGIIKLKAKDNWDDKPTRVIGPMQTTASGVEWHPWLPSNPWHVWHGNRPWHAGIHNVWSLGPVMFRWASWAENGPLPVAQGRGQAIAAEDWYARTYNKKWIAARPVHIHPFSQPVTAQSPGYSDAV